MPLAIVRGGGDLATGAIYRLWRVGFSVLVLEIRYPSAIRRAVSAAQAVFVGSHVVEGMQARLCSSPLEVPDDGSVGVLIDPEGKCISELKPDLLVDAIMAKRNTGTKRSMAPCVVALGPGFRAPRDVHAVVETLRGHGLGRVIADGEAVPDTGTPGEIGGASLKRLLRSPADGFFESDFSIGDSVEAGQAVGRVEGLPVYAELSGVVRGMVHSTVPVTRGMKIGDVDPRGTRENCFTVSDKALAVGGGVLEAALTGFLSPGRGKFGPKVST